jgi:hypothetical protein
VQIDTFASLLRELIDGMPIGHAVEYFNERYAALATALTEELKGVRFGRIADEEHKQNLTGIWLEHNDARNYVILGDPAVRLRTVEGAGAEHPDQAAALRPLPMPPSPGGDLPEARAPQPGDRPPGGGG